MTKMKAIYQFFSSFGLTAYDEHSVPSNAEFPYITYSIGFGGMDVPISLNANIWTRNESWLNADEWSDLISDRLSEGGTQLPYDGGSLWLTKGSPFAQRLGDEKDDMIKRYIFNINANFLGKE